jgi:hypothetical protein
MSVSFKSIYSTPYPALRMFFLKKREKEEADLDNLKI